MESHTFDPPQGPSYFYTVNLDARGSRLLTDRIELLRFAFAKTHEERPFKVGAMVVLPDHIHALWTMPEHDSDAEARWRLIKSWFVQGLEEDTLLGNTRLWQGRHWQRRIRTADAYRTHRDYCWSDPVRHGYVSRASDWEYSSIHRDIAAGVVAADWVGSPTAFAAMGDACPDAA